MTLLAIIIAWIAIGLVLGPATLVIDKYDDVCRTTWGGDISRRGFAWSLFWGAVCGPFTLIAVGITLAVLFWPDAYSESGRARSAWWSTSVLERRRS